MTCYAEGCGQADPREYARRQVKKTAALLKEYGTADLAAIEKIKAEQAKKKAEIMKANAERRKK